MFYSNTITLLDETRIFSWFLQIAVLVLLLFWEPDGRELYILLFLLAMIGTVDAIVSVQQTSKYAGSKYSSYVVLRGATLIWHNL